MEEYFILAAAIFLGFFIQAITGFSAALFALPLMLLILDLQESMAILSVLLVLFSILEVYNTRKSINRKIFKELIVWTIIGIAIGIYMLNYGNQTFLKKILGFLILGYVGYNFIQKRRMKSLNRYGPFFGVVSGFFSGAFASGGSILALYLNNKLTKARNIRATIIGVLAISNFSRVPFMVYSDILTYDIFMKSIFLLPVFFIALYFGKRSFDKMNDQFFRNSIMFLLLLSGISLIFG